jgi:hypothetical protein
MTRPLRSTPITGASPLLRAGPPAGPATVLTPTPSAGYSLSPTRKIRTGSVEPGLLPFHARAADRARVAFMPDTAWPISGHPPGSSRNRWHTPVSMSSVAVSTRQQRIACARLPDPHLTHLVRLFHIAHHDRVTTPAACGGLKPPPTGRLRRADNPPSPAQHRFRKLYLHRTPFHVRDTHQRSMWRFGILPRRTMPKGQPSSLAQHQLTKARLHHQKPPFAVHGTRSGVVD